jgi:protein SMG7
MQNRQSYAQLPGNNKVPPAKTVPPRSTARGRGRGRGEVRFQPKDTVTEIAERDPECSVRDTLKAFYVRFVRLNGILFTRTRYFTHPCMIERVIFIPAVDG